MTIPEIMSTPFGEMLDMISCLAIYNGAEEAKPKLSHAEIMNLR